MVGHINCHATSTPLGDLIELVAIGRLLASATPDSFGPPLSIFVNSIKGHLGHCLGAAGAIEAAYTVLSVACGQIVACLNLESPPSNDHFTAALTNLVSTITSESWLRPFQEQAESSYPRINLLSAADDTGPSVAWPDEKRPRIALTNSFGFGGTNASLVISEFLPVGESASAK
ncbi:unnamed protein product [Protopolystoma xenopodis]|uniref:beta-ketoacyl-[acyl-carrier-protein] synthase I n=1 Tax=Protopolystoma xenopodis TaxID=117903 RepID=A0A448XGG6_9PLAT|nr:unnamed protein product [Protopolystoma xenopodis]